MRFSDELKQQIIEDHRSSQSQGPIARSLKLYSASVSWILRESRDCFHDGPKRAAETVKAYTSGHSPALVVGYLQLLQKC